jgi:tetratricopeptide (TPR) repeat protein
LQSTEYLRRAAAIGLFSLGWLTAQIAVAQPVTPEQSARAHHEQGRLQYSLGRYETAISEFRKAYELRADPSFLFDIAEAYRSLDAPERAVFFYRRYLTTHPNPPNRAEVEAQIALIEPTVPASAPSADTGTTGGKPGNTGMSGKSGSSGSPGPFPFQPPPGLSSSVGLEPGPPRGKDQDGLRDRWRGVVGRWWFWTAIGTLAAAGATIAILAMGPSSEDRVPSSDLGHVKLF